MESIKLNVLVVDDDAVSTKDLESGLKALGCETTAVNSLEEAVHQLKTLSYDLILTNTIEANDSGVLLLNSGSVKGHSPLIVYLTENPTYETTVASVKAGAFDYLQKPVTTLNLEYMLTKVEKFILVHRENITLKLNRTRSDYFAGLVSQAMENLENFVKKISPTEMPILISGENGTGKSLLARLIHQKSNRALKPFVKFYCSQSAEQNTESDLFFQEKIEAAAGGTLLLDEIGDLALETQAKLVQFLQDKTLVKVENHSPVTIDTRLIFTTTKNLSEAVAAGHFREDLYYRMKLFETNIVPLRHRREDISALTQKFVQESNATNPRKNLTEISDSLKSALSNYDWPGNVRELRNCVERLVMLTEEEILDEKNLPKCIRADYSSVTSAAESPCYTTLQVIEKEHIQKVLSAETNLERAAEILGISTVTLWRKRKDYGLSASV